MARDTQNMGVKTPLSVQSPTYTLRPTQGIQRGAGPDWFGPLNPMAPVAPPGVRGRILDFNSGYNLVQRPKAYEPISFEMLRNFADSYDILRLVIETRKDQMSRLRWNIVTRGHAKKRAKDPEMLEAIEQVERFFVRPDGQHFWDEWLRMILEDLLVLDAPSVFRRRTFGGDLYALEPIDGSTIKRVIDDWGRTPKPPVTAYQQVLKGMPAVDYTSSDLIYRPRNLRTHKVYGYSPVEQVLMTVNIGLRRQVWQLQSFTEGNIPEALIGTPSTWTPDQIKNFQDWFDSNLEGQTGARRRARFVPGEVAKGYVPTKEGELFGAAEEWLARVICYAFGVSPQAFVKMMNRATAETAQETAAEEGLAPIQQWVKGFMDAIILDDFENEDLEFEWLDEDELDPNIKSQILDRDTSSGLMTFNEARVEQGQDPYDHPDANRPMFKAATGWTPIFLTAEEQAEKDAMAAQIAGAAPELDENGDPIPLEVDENGDPIPPKTPGKVPPRIGPDGKPILVPPGVKKPPAPLPPKGVVEKGDLPFPEPMNSAHDCTSHAPARGGLAKAYNEDQERDENGRWTSGDVQSLSDYAGESPDHNAIGINGALRIGQPLTEVQTKVLTGVDKAFERASVSDKRMVLYRGTTTAVHGWGKEEKGYISTSRTVDVAHEFASNGEHPQLATIYEIEVPKGSSYIDMKGFAPESVDYQREVLLPRGGRIDYHPSKETYRDKNDRLIQPMRWTPPSKAEKLAKAYNEDQERDENGRWSSGGGGISANEAKELGVSEAWAGKISQDDIDGLREVIANGGSQGEVLAAMQPLYDAMPPEGESTLTLDKDGEPPVGFFDDRGYNVNGEVVDHDRAITHLVEESGKYASEGGTRQDREATIILGPSAAGKSGFANEIAERTGSAIVDSDDAKYIIPEYNGGLGANAVHEESSQMGRAMELRLSDSGTNMVIPTVGATVEGIQTRIDRLQLLGYKVSLVDVHVDKDEATRRMAMRSLSTGRVIGADYVVRVGDRPTQTYESLKGNADGYARIDANGPVGTARVTESSGLAWSSAGEPILGKSAEGRGAVRGSDAGWGVSGIVRSEEAVSSAKPGQEVLAKADKRYVDPDRPKIARLQRRLKVRIKAVLRAAAKSVSGQVKAKLTELGKADKPKIDVDAILASLDLEMFETLQDDIETGLHTVYSDGGKVALAQLGSRVGNDLVNQVSERSLNWAKQHAADLVGVSDDPDYSIPDATREMLRATIASGIESNLSAEDIAASIEDGYAFSEDRAALIAMTEINSANSMGALAGYEEAKGAGVKLGKSWLMLEDACPICQENADEGVIELDEEFPSGDLAPPGHPNCRCVLVPEVEDGEEPVDETSTSDE